MFDRTNEPNHLPAVAEVTREAIALKEHSDHERQLVVVVDLFFQVSNKKSVRFLGREFPSAK